MSNIRSKKVVLDTVVFSVLMFGLLLHPRISNSQKRAILLDKTVRIEKMTPSTLFMYNDPKNIALDFNLYVSFHKTRGLLKIGFNTREGNDINLLETIDRIDAENIKNYVNRSFRATSGNLKCTAAIIDCKKYMLTHFKDRKGSKYRLKWIDLHVIVERSQDVLDR